MKKLFPVLAVCGALAASAQAADPYLIAGFYPISAGQSENPNVRGFGLVAYDEVNGQTGLIFLVSNLLPNQEYGVNFQAEDVGGASPIAFTTDSFGRGAFVSTYLQTPLNPTTPLVQIFSSDPFDPEYPENWGTVEEHELRAQGFGFSLRFR